MGRFFLSPVYYELDPKFEIFQEEISQLQNKYSGTSFFTDIWRFAGFYKKNKFQNENEIRLAGIFPIRSQEESLKYVRKELRIEEDRNRIVSYIPLKLWIDPDSFYYKTLDVSNVSFGTFDLNKSNLPQLKIEEIHFGNNCGLSNEEYWKFQSELKEIFEWRLGYSINLPLNLYQ